MFEYLFYSLRGVLNMYYMCIRCLLLTFNLYSRINYRILVFWWWMHSTRQVFFDFLLFNLNFLHTHTHSFVHTYVLTCALTYVLRQTRWPISRGSEKGKRGNTHTHTHTRTCTHDTSTIGYDVQVYNIMIVLWKYDIMILW